MDNARYQELSEQFRSIGFELTESITERETLDFFARRREEIRQARLGGTHPLSYCPQLNYLLPKSATRSRYKGSESHHCPLCGELYREPDGHPLIHPADRPDDYVDQTVPAIPGTVVWVMIEDESELNHWYRFRVLFFERRYHPRDLVPYYWAPICVQTNDAEPTLFTEDDLTEDAVKNIFGADKSRYQYFQIATEDDGHPTSWPSMPEYRYVDD